MSTNDNEIIPQRKEEPTFNSNHSFHLKQRMEAIEAILHGGFGGGITIQQFDGEKWMDLRVAAINDLAPEIRYRAKPKPRKWEAGEVPSPCWVRAKKGWGDQDRRWLVIQIEAEGVYTGAFNKRISFKDLLEQFEWSTTANAADDLWLPCGIQE